MSSIIKLILLSFCVLTVTSCSQDASHQLQQLDAIEKQVFSLKKRDEKSENSKHIFSLSELIEHSQTNSFTAISQNIKNIILQAESDGLYYSLFPKVSAYSSFGQSVFVRRDEENTDIRISPVVTWDIIRLLEYGKINEFQEATQKEVDLRTSLTNKQILLEVVRLYNDLMISIEKYNQLELSFKVAKKEYQIAVYTSANSGSNFARISAAKKALQEAERNLTLSETEKSLARMNLVTFCNLPKDTKIASFADKEITFSPEPLGDYILKTISQSEGVAVSTLLEHTSKQKVDLLKSERWLNFQFNANLGDILSNLSSAPFSTLTWTFSLFDQGDFDRKVIQARTAQLLQMIDTESQKSDLINVAGQTWISVYESAFLYNQQILDLKTARKEFLIVETQHKNGIYNTDKYATAKQKLIDAETMTRIRHANYLASVIRYSTLSGGDTSIWIN